MDSQTERFRVPSGARGGEIEVIDPFDRELPIWGPQLVVAGAIVLAFALPTKLTLGPHRLLPSAERLLLVGLVMASPRPRQCAIPDARWAAVALIARQRHQHRVARTVVHFLLQRGQDSGGALIQAGACCT